MQPEPRQSHPPENIDLLWEAFLAGALDPAGAETLLQHLENNPEELQRRRADARMHACLANLLEPPEQIRPLVLSVQARLAGKKPNSASGRFKQSVMTVVKRKSRHARPRRHTAVWSRILVVAAVALVAIGILAIVHFSASKPTGPATADNPIPAPPATEARLTVRQGRVQLLEHTHEQAESVALPLHAQLRLEPQSVAVVTLPDGSSLELSAQAKLTLQDSDQGPRVQLDEGIAQIHVTKQPAGSSFQIQTPLATAKVLGTHFTVEAFDRISSVKVSEGSVRVSSPVPTCLPVVLAAGDELRADPTGLGTPLRNAHWRVLAPDLGHAKTFTDPVLSAPVPGEQFRGLTLQRLTCFSPTGPDAVGYCGWEWPVTLASEETYVEMWFRPRKIVPRAAGAETPTLVMLANLGTTEYRVGEIQLSPADSGWMVLRGRLTGEAPVNWTKPGSDPLPLEPAKVQQIEIRNEQADMEFDHSGLLLWSTKH